MSHDEQDAAADEQDAAADGTDTTAGRPGGRAGGTRGAAGDEHADAIDGVSSFKPVGHLYELRDVERRYDRGGTTVRALHDVQLDVSPGEFLSIEGPSGSGKSTLLQLLGALEVPTSGTIRFDGNELGRASDSSLTRIRSAEIGFVFQQFNLIPTLTAVENVAIAMVPRQRSKTERRRRSEELLEQVGLGGRLGHLPSRLSGGEQQRVAIARALANRPRAIVADEPTGNLDSESAEGVMTLLVGLQSGPEPVTVIVATHDDDVARHAGRRIKLRDGAMVEDAVQ